MLTKLLYGITALILALALGGFAVQTARLSKAENRAVEATKMAQEYEGSLRSLEALRKAEKLAADSTAAVLKKRAAQAEKDAATAKKESESLRESIKANPDWANAPLPAGVRQSLNR